MYIGLNGASTTVAGRKETGQQEWSNKDGILETEFRSQGEHSLLLLSNLSREASLRWAAVKTEIHAQLGSQERESLWRTQHYFHTHHTYTQRIQ